MLNFFQANNKQRYYQKIIKEDNKYLYNFNSKFANQEAKLLKMYGPCNEFNKKIKLIIISDTHNSLNKEEFKNFLNNHQDYDLCILLGDHHANDIEIILELIDKQKLYGLLGNHDNDYLTEYNINNLNGKVINLNNVTLLGMQGSFRYKPSDFPSFSQKESILFLNDKPKVDILLTHDNRFDSAMQYNPAHQGLFGITYYIYKNNVPIHIHGHVHNNYQKTLNNGTKEISVFMYQYLEL